MEISEERRMSVRPSPMQSAQEEPEPSHEASVLPAHDLNVIPPGADNQEEAKIPEPEAPRESSPPDQPTEVNETVLASVHRLGSKRIRASEGVASMF